MTAIGKMNLYWINMLTKKTPKVWKKIATTNKIIENLN